MDDTTRVNDFQMNGGGEQYKGFLEQRQKIASLMDQQGEVLESLGMTTLVGNIGNLSKSVLEDNFKVLVIGQFNGGKSTLINALLREDVLPADPRPYTAIISEVKWGDKRKAMLHFKKNGTAKPPQEVNVEDLDNHLAVNYEQWHADAGKQIRESPYDKVELFWPLELCRHGVEIIDSPGLNANEVHQKITMDYLGTVDAVLFILSCEALASKYEMDIVTNILQPAGYEDIFFICNRINQIHRDKDKEKVKEFGRVRLGQYTRSGAKHVFFINALGAVDGYLSGDEEQIAESGVRPLESALETFLAKEKGRVKITRASKELHSSIDEARQAIPEREAMLRTNLETLEGRYAEAQEPMGQLEERRQQIVQQTTLIHEELKQRVEAKVETLYRDLADKVDGWVQDYVVMKPLKGTELIRKATREQAIERVSAEIADHISTQVDPAAREWQKVELQPVLEESAQKLSLYLDSSMEDFLSRLDEVRVEMAHGTSQPTGISERDVPASERVLAGIGGLLVGGPGMAWTGAAFGYQELARTLMPQIGLTLAAYLVIGLNPFTAVPGIIYALYRMGRLGGMVTEQVKEEVGKQYANELKLQSRDGARKVTGEIGKAFDTLEEAVDQGLGAQIQNLRDQVESVLDEKRKGQAEIDKATRELSAARKQLDEIDGKLYDLMSEIAIA